jgi:hypothetical protein
LPQSLTQNYSLKCRLIVKFFCDSLSSKSNKRVYHCPDFNSNRTWSHVGPRRKGEPIPPHYVPASQCIDIKISKNHTTSECNISASFSLQSNKTPPKKGTKEVRRNAAAFGGVKNLIMECVGLPNVGKSSYSIFRQSSKLHLKTILSRMYIFQVLVS